MKQKKIRSLPKKLVGSWKNAKRNLRFLDLLCMLFRPKILDVLGQNHQTVSPDIDETLTEKTGSTARWPRRKIQGTTDQTSPWTLGR